MTTAAHLLGERRALRLRAQIERYAYWHGARAHLDGETWRRLTQGTAILMYHAVGRPGEVGTRFVVPARRLRHQLLLIRWSRRPVISLSDLVRARQAGTLPPAGAIVITFDDGFADNGELAAPLLSGLGTPATLFVVSDRVGGAADWQGAGELASRPLVDWATLADIARAGIEIGAHTRTHPRLPELEHDRAADEIAGSREALSSRLGVEVRAFCYPYGRKSRDVVRIVEDSGFSCACGIERGLNYAATPLHELRRVPVDGAASVVRFLLGVGFGDPDLLHRLLGRLRRQATHHPTRPHHQPEVENA